MKLKMRKYLNKILEKCNKKLLLLPMFLILSSCYDQECNCELYKTGKFEFVQEIGPF